MRNLAVVSLVSLVAVIGCTRIEYLEYRGDQSWPTGSAFIQTIDGVDVYEGLPPCTYDVIGLIDIYDEKAFYLDSAIRSKVICLAKTHGADAIIWLSDRTISTGFFEQNKHKTDQSSVDTGRSSQPEILISNVNQSTVTSYKKSLRSSLLLVRWKK
jgi:hypothetical protein